MAKLLAEATIQGIDFTFERRPCGKDIYGHVICSHSPSGIGYSNVEKYTSTRIGVCKEFINSQFRDSPEVDAVWANSEEGQAHIGRILRMRQARLDKDALYEEAGLRSGDSITEAYNGHSIRIHGLTREDALRAYKAAIDSLGEE